MISDDLAPAVAWAPPTKKTTLFIARLGNQAINPVGKAHATIRSSITRPTRRRGGFIRQGSFLWYSVRKFFASLRLTLLHHKS